MTLACNVRYFCGVALLIFVSTIMLCSMGFTVVVPYRATLKWVHDTCRVVNTSYAADMCSCQKDHPSGSVDMNSRCLDQYPCLTINVELTENRSAEHVLPLFRSWDDSFFNTCSLHECGDEEWNIKETRRFRYLWGQPDSTYPCYYNPDDPEQAILERITYAQAVHAIAWPSAALGAGILIWLGLCLGCWKIEMDHNQEPIIDRTSGFL